MSSITTVIKIMNTVITGTIFFLNWLEVIYNCSPNSHCLTAKTKQPKSLKKFERPSFKGAWIHQLGSCKKEAITITTQVTKLPADAKLK